ncbi:MAG TPA: class I SAM-dependent methyltransferase [Vicinamibacterales bacterium]|nr:class I SAM-dependent methyltransferase [Vicinamibacterales bacterium]
MSETTPLIFTPEYYKRMRDLEAGFWWNAGMRDIAAMLLQLAPLPRRGVLLDVGCGSGQTMTWFGGTHSGWSTVGIDVAPEGLAAARGIGLNVLRASALDIPIQSQSVDLVITLDVLQHVPLGGGDVKAISEISRVLKPGGYLFARTNAQAFPYTPDDPVFNFHKYRPDELSAKLTTGGLRVLRLSRVNAILGLAEIPRELRARKQEHSYHGILAQPRATGGLVHSLKRAWLGLEGRAARRGFRWPLGRTIVTLCRK